MTKEPTRKGTAKRSSKRAQSSETLSRNGLELRRNFAFVVVFTASTGHKRQIDELMKERGGTLLSEMSDRSEMRQAVNSTDHVAVYQLTTELGDEQLQEAQDVLSELGAVACPVFASDLDAVETHVAVRPDVLIVSQGAGAETLIDQAAELGFEHDRHRSQYLSGKMYFRSSDASWRRNREVFKTLEDEVGRTVSVESIPLLSPTCWSPSDLHYSDQWNLDAVEWHHDYVSPVTTTSIAILDEGFDLAHPDLKFASPGLNLGTLAPSGAPTGSHGTPCAGIAAATSENNAEGISGLAHRTKVLPLAVASWSDVEVAMGINVAASFGVDAVSMSFGVYDHWNVWDYQLIDAEIMFATNAGVVLCAASGNENSASRNRYPGKHPLVICVGGSNRNDERKSQGDASAEPFWGACYGLEMFRGALSGVSVVAPCLEVPATDRLGQSGYAPGSYTLGFNGTSSACPQVAALAVLVRSAMPGANSATVRRVIEQSADKVGPYDYTHHSEFPNSSWTQEVGHGRINVRRALKLAGEFACPATCCHSEGSDDLVAFSAGGKSHVSTGDDVHVEDFADVYLNEGGAWSDSTFVASVDGVYAFNWSFVKDAHYHDGTTDDVSIHLRVNGLQVGPVAWSGEGDGTRGTGAADVLLRLAAGARVTPWVHSDGGKKRHLARFSLSGHRVG